LVLSKSLKRYDIVFELYSLSSFNQHLFLTIQAAPETQRHQPFPQSYGAYLPCYGTHHSEKQNQATPSTNHHCVSSTVGRGLNVATPVNSCVVL
jgi:hypothetical protein